mmetsp:Transcript_43388/g.84737  ORF Transcript_43388/g.84737 Transcript_43388/m.84737 type:complete len:210 (+) Transcript_43388:120-749(+)
MQGGAAASPEAEAAIRGLARPPQRARAQPSARDAGGIFGRQPILPRPPVAPHNAAGPGRRGGGGGEGDVGRRAKQVWVGSERPAAQQRDPQPAAGAAPNPPTTAGGGGAADLGQADQEGHGEGVPVRADAVPEAVLPVLPQRPAVRSRMFVRQLLQRRQARVGEGAGHPQHPRQPPHGLPRHGAGARGPGRPVAGGDGQDGQGMQMQTQ